MAATITSTGTWTTLSTDLSPYRLNAQTTTSANTSSMNSPQVGPLIAADFATSGRNNVPSEVFRFIELIQNGYGSAPGTSGNNRVGFWPAAALLRAWLNALFSGQVYTDPGTTVAISRAAADV